MALGQISTGLTIGALLLTAGPADAEDKRVAALSHRSSPAAQKIATPAALPSGWTDPSTPYPYIALDQPVRDILAEFGRNLGLPVIVADDVDGVISINAANLPPQAFFKEVARKAGLQWYYDGVSLHVVRTEDARSRLVDLGGTSLSVVRKAVAELGLADDRFPIRQAGRTGLAIIAGPTPYVETVENVVRALGGRDVKTALAAGAELPGATSSGVVPRVFRGVTR